MRRGTALAAAAVAAAAAAAFAGVQVAHAVGRDGHDRGSAASCVLGNRGDSRVQHVIYLQFDNTHYNRDNPNVPSDLEQMTRRTS